MVPTAFDEKTTVLDAPDGVPLSITRGVINDTPVMVSCWKMTQEELEEFQRTGRIWLIVRGQIHPQVLLTAQKPFLA